MRTVIALSLVVALNGCANRKTAMGLAAASAVALVYAAVELGDQPMYCNNAFDGEWGATHACNNNVLIGFGAGVTLGIAAAVVWARADHQSEMGDERDELARAQRTRFLANQASEAAASGDCARAQERTNRMAAIDPASVGALAARDAAVRACLSPATTVPP